jgi:hypothetical protein
MKRKFLRRLPGFTLIELTLAIGLGMTIAAMLLALFNQQLVFLKIFSDQNFIAEEAPLINMYVGRIAGKADRFRLHANKTDALTVNLTAGRELSGKDQRLTASPVLLMNFRQPDGSMRASMLVSETNSANKPVLNYYVIPAVNTGVPLAPEWTITKRAKEVSFSVEQGILRMKIKGPLDEEITYSGTMQQ